METEEIIICKSCNEAKPLSDFQISKHFKSGHATICKACHGKRIAAAHIARKTQCTPPHEICGNPKFADQSPRQLIASLRELIAELKSRGYSYKGELTYIQTIKI